MQRPPPERSSRRSASSAARVIFSPTTDPIEPPMKRYSMTARDHRQALDLTFHHPHSLGRARRLLVLLQATLVGLGVPELQRIGRQIPVKSSLRLLFVEEELDPLWSRDSKVIAAFGTDLKVLDQLLGIDDLATAVTLHPQTLRALDSAVGPRPRAWASCFS